MRSTTWSIAPEVAELTSDSVEQLCERLGYRFADPRLIIAAMSHRSWVSEHPGNESNERLEYLGDAILGWIVADLVYRRFPDYPEGHLTDLRKGVVNAEALAATAAELGIGPCLLLGRGEDAAGGRNKESILSDAFEALLAAVYLDGGVDEAAAIVERHLGPLLEIADLGRDRIDEKSALQELVARLQLEPPKYRVSSEGPDHRKRFEATVSVGDRDLGFGTGGSKKAAERAAARAALATLDDSA